MSTMDDLTVVVEGRTDALLLVRVLSRALGIKPGFFAAAGGLSLSTLARNILVHEGGQVLVVMDSDTVDALAAAEARALTRATMRPFAADAQFDVFAFIPQIEVAFFEVPCVLRRHLAGEIDDSDLEVGMVDSARRLDALLERDGQTRERFYRELQDEDIDELLTGPQMARLIEAADALFSSCGV